MTTIKAFSLIERYRTEDQDQRTALFLGYPELRSDFLAMEMADYRSRSGAMPERDTQTGPARRNYPVLIIGAGLNGLAAAYELKKKGIATAILDASDKPAAAWRSRHDQLRLNTHRLISYLPGMRIPRRCGAFPGRDDIVDYLAAYEQRFDLTVRRNVRIHRIDPADDGWQLTASDGIWRARDIIVATGNERVPFIPHWKGCEGFTGELLHAARLGSIERFRDLRVLVVGAGNSGTDVLNHLVRIRTKAVWVSIRNGPTMLPSRVLGIPLQLFSPLMVPLPSRVMDVLMAANERLAFGNLRKYHLPKHPDGVATRLIKEGVAPAFDDGFVAALKVGRVTVLPQIERFEGPDVRLTGGKTVRPDAVICATGYRPGLEDLVGHLGVLDETGRPRFNGSESHPDVQGLWFTGMTPRLPGVFYAARKEARRVAKAIEKRQTVQYQEKVITAPVFVKSGSAAR